MKKIMEKWPNDVRILLHNRPLDFHKRAMPAALAAMAAHKQGKFWEYHDILFERKKFEDQDLRGFAQELGLDVARFDADRSDPALEGFVKEQDAACVKVGASGTPAFFVNGRKLSGAKPFEDFVPVIEEELAKAKAMVAKGTPREKVYDAILKAAKKSASPQLASSVARFDLNGAPSEGPASAPATLVIFSDFECPFCSRLVEPVHDAVKTLKGQLRVVFKQYPLTSIHPNARDAALASLAANRQGKFWEYHDLLFRNQKRLTGPDLRTWAQALGLDMARFEKDIADPALVRQLQIDQRDAINAGVSGTPSSFLNGRRLKSPPTNAEALVDLIESEILGK